MKDDAIRAQIHQAVDHHARHIRPDPFLARRIMAQERKGELNMKKKASFGLVFVLVLILLTATAFALTNWEALAKYFEKTRSMAQTGELDRFSQEDQLKLLNAMAEAGLVRPDDPRLALAQDEALPISERARAAQEIIAERYGPDYFDFLDIEKIELSKNPISAEDQKAYEAWAEENEKKAARQTQEPINETRTYRDVAGMLTEIGVFPRELIRDVRVTSEYSETEKRWTVVASVDKEKYVQAMRRQAADDGNVFSYYGYTEGDTWNIRFYLDAYGNYLGLYNADDPEQRASLSLEDAYPLALAAAQARLHVSKAELEQMKLRQFHADSSVYDLKQGRFRACCEFWWYDGDQPVYIIEIDAENGQALKAINYVESEQMKEKERVWTAELERCIEAAGASASLNNSKKVFFWNWTVEEKAAWSQTAYPAAQQYYAEHPEFVQYLRDVEAGKYIEKSWPTLCTVTRYLYGVPDEAAIPQEQAFAIAREYALSQGVRQSDIDENKLHQFYYDVTDPARPLWKVNVFLLFGDGDLAHQGDGTDPWGCFVAIDAHTGEIVRTVMRDVNTHLWDIV
ncbi:MAG: hypothetical protein IKQ41_03580 [Clostridia bacterium]|nr:hypothetical protein [Clostridia bacterium]